MPKFTYSAWRHGGWYVPEVRYPSGACGCVSRNYPDKKWRIVCDPRPFEKRPTFANRDDAAAAEMILAEEKRAQLNAAAPELLAALELIDIDSLPDDVQIYVRAAIAKAEGGANV